MAFTADINEDLLGSVADFRMITMASTDASLFYLRAMGGKMEAALDYFYRTGGKAHKGALGVASSHPSSVAASEQQSAAPPSQESWEVTDDPQQAAALSVPAEQLAAEAFAQAAEEGDARPPLGMDAPWDAGEVPSEMPATAQADSASYSAAAVGYDPDNLLPPFEVDVYANIAEMQDSRWRRHRGHASDRFLVLYREDYAQLAQHSAQAQEPYQTMLACAQESPAAEALWGPDAAPAAAQDEQSANTGACPLAAESEGDVVPKHKPKPSKRQRGGSPAPQTEQVPAPHVDVTALKTQLREELEKAMIRIRAERQEKLDLERAGNYVLHFTKVRELLTTLEMPQWGSAQDFFAIFPREGVPEHGEAFLRLYRKFRHAALGDVSAKLTNGELRFIRDLSAKVKAERESSSSSSDEPDSSCSDETGDDDSNGAPSLTVPAGRRGGGRGSRGGRGRGRGRAATTTESSDFTSRTDSKPTLLPGDDSSSSEEEEPTDSDAPKILRRRRTTTSAAKRLRVDTEASASPPPPQTLPASATRAPTSTLRQRTLSGAVVQPAGGEIRPPRRSSAQHRIPSSQLTELLKRERAAMDFTRLLTASGISYPVTPSNLPGELPTKTRVLLSTLRVDLSCVPEAFLQRYPPRKAENVLICLLLCCSRCTSTTAWSGSYSFAKRMFGVLCEEIGVPNMFRCMYNVESLLPVVAAWRADFEIPCCTDESHKRLSETIALSQSFIWYTPKKHELRELVEFTCSAPTLGPNRHRCTIEIRTRPWVPRKTAVEPQIRRIELMHHLCYWMASELKAHSRTARVEMPELNRYPMMSWESIRSLAKDAAKCASFGQLVDAAAVKPPTAAAPSGTSATALPCAEAPAGISLSLKKHQQENLAFLLRREQNGARDGFEIPVPSDPKIVMIWCPLTCQLRFMDTRAATREVLDLTNPDIRGGLLCDDMGLGKTLCLLSLIVANPMRAPPPPKSCRLSLLDQWEFKGLQQYVPMESIGGGSRDASSSMVGDEYLSDDEATESKPAIHTILNPHYAQITANPLTNKMLSSEFYRNRHTLKPIKATLVVVPVSITGQWMAEIQRCAPRLRFMLFHGPDRHNFTMTEFEQADVILTTYETLAQQIRGECMHAAHCSFAGRCDKETLAVLAQQVDSFVRFPNTSTTSIVPSALTGTLANSSFLSGQTLDARTEAMYFRDFLSIRPVQVHLSRLLFHRCVFDECQKAAGGSFDVVDHVHSTYRWAVTGTPIGNSIDTLGRLLCTVGAKLPTRPLSFVRMVDERDCWAWFNSYSLSDLYTILAEHAKRDTAANKVVAAEVAKKQKEKSYEFATLDLFSSKNTSNRRWGVLQLLRAHMMRHCKTADIVQDIAIPTRQEVFVGVDLTSEEITLYERAAKRVREDFTQLAKQGRTGNRMSRVHMWIDVLQRSALHPEMVSESRTLGALVGGSTGAQNENERHRFVVVTPEKLRERLDADNKRHSHHPVPTVAFETLNLMMEVPPEVGECAVCMTTMAQPAMLRCHHFYCKECVLNLISTSNVEPRCPTCRANTVSSDKEKYLVSLPLPQVTVEEEEALAKLKQSVGDGSKARSIVALVEQLLQQDSTNRFVVFSQFPQLLHRLLGALSSKAIAAFIIDGSTSLKERARRIAEFQAVSSSMKVCMISSRAGNAGLTLTAANHLILAEPNLNIAAEQQAASRIHRLGQLRPVTVHHLYTCGTIEERIHALAISGQLAAQGGNNGDSNSRALNQATYLLC